MNKRKFIKPTKIQNPGANHSILSIESDMSIDSPTDNVKTLKKALEVSVDEERTKQKDFKSRK